MKRWFMNVVLGMVLLVGLAGSPVYAEEAETQSFVVPAATQFTVTGAFGGRNVTFKSDTEDAVIYYSSSTSKLTTDDICVENGETVLFENFYGTLYARSYKDGVWGNVSKLILKIPKTATPVITADGESVIIKSSTPDSYICYTTDGTAPSWENGKRIAKSGGTVKVTAGSTVRAVAVRSCFAYSDEVQAQVQTETVEPVAFTVKGIINGRNVKMESATEGAEIYYSTTTGSITTSDARLENGADVDFNNYYGTLYARAYKDGKWSNVSRLILKIPQVSTPSVTVKGRNVTIKTSTPNCTIYYTTDGSTPSVTNGTRVSGSKAEFSVSFGTTVRAIAVRSCFGNSEEVSVDISNNYPQVDMFSDSYNIKGMQGANSGSQSMYGGLSHSLINVQLDQAIFSPDSAYAKNGWVYAYEFEGETFYFTDYPTGMANVPKCNSSNMSVSVVFLLKWNDGSRDSYHNDTNFLIDEDSRVEGYTYYAPNADLSTYGGRAIRAYWHFLMEFLEKEGYHIDNFILGNEVNMPNHWHYSGSTDVSVVAAKYADAFYYMYEAVREYTDVSRCSISIDHSWNHNDEGRGIGARTFLHVFHNRLAQHSSKVDWCVSAHLYPSILYETRIWHHIYGLTTNSSDTQMVDGTNLSAMTNYIRDTFGSEHRVMLTEQGFSNYYGSEAQAACLAYTYYAAMYDPMVDSFLINTENAGSMVDFRIDGTTAETVYTKIGNGNAEDAQWIADTCLPVIGVNSWEAIIPNYGK